MLLDAKLLLSNQQAITATAASTDVIDRGDTKDVGKAMAPIAMFALMNRDHVEARRFIEGFQ